jgi:hypothetical protein
MTEDDTASLSRSAYLIWEESDKETWWLARSHDGASTFVIAPDQLTGHVLTLRQDGESGPFDVIAAVPATANAETAKLVAEAKRLGVRWLSDNADPAIRTSVRNWRLIRWTKIATRELPLAILSVATGAFLAFVVAAFFILTGLAGWTMIAVGTVLGALAGWVLKWLADLKLASVLGATGRFYTVTGSAVLGAVTTLAIFFTLFVGV